MEGNVGTFAVLALVAVVSLAGMIYPFKPFKKRWAALIAFFVSLILIGVLGSSPKTTESAMLALNERPWAKPKGEEQLWVTSERLNRRTCPSESCGIVGRLFFRESVTAHEAHNGWTRITQFYDASCAGGHSQYVDTGNTACNSVNGITDGQFAEWVSTDYLSETRPPDPAAGAAGIEAWVAESDDFARYRTAFALAAQSLVAQRRCTEGDFRDMGGWIKSSNHPDQPIYFTYCGGATVANRLYLNADTGEIFR